MVIWYTNSYTGNGAENVVLTPPTDKKLAITEVTVIGSSAATIIVWMGGNSSNTKKRLIYGAFAANSGEKDHDRYIGKTNEALKVSGSAGTIYLKVKYEVVN